MESTDSSAGSPRQHQPNLPPGFRFHPTDEELVVHYLKKKVVSAPLPVAIIAEVDLYKFDPWELPAKATFGEQEWYFFTPRDRKYPNGARPNRAATSGYWKATGTDKPVLTSGGTHKVGVKKALVFYGGKPPKGIKTNWIMHEYRLAENRPNNRPPGYHDPANKKNSLRLDDWVLCRIYKKANASRPLDHHHDGSILTDGMFEGPTNNITTNNNNNHSLMSMMSVLGPHNISKLPKPASASASAATVMSYSAAAGLSENDHQLFDGMLSSNNNNSNPKRAAAALPGMYWSGEAEPSKPGLGHHHESSTSADYAEPASLLSQPALHQGHHAMLGALGDGIFQSPFPLPGMNWYS